MLDRIALIIFSVLIVLSMLLDIAVGTGGLKANLYGLVYIGLLNALSLFGYFMVLFLMRLERIYGDE